MITRRVGNSEPVTAARSATECLTKRQLGLLSTSDIISMIMIGFELNDVRAMISLSKLYSTPQITERIVGHASLTMKRQRAVADPVRLSARQSAVAFQYAETLERAKSVFGTQAFAEEWLIRPCKHLAGLIPLDLIDNVIGFQVLKDYFLRIELGIYQ